MMEKQISLRLVETMVVRVRRHKWNGEDRLDIRMFCKPRNDGQWLPTKRGVFIPFRKKKQLIKLIEQTK